jgi:hypothetical protein
MLGEIWFEVTAPRAYDSPTMTFRTKDPVRWVLTKLGTPLAALSIWLHLATKREEHVAPPSEHVHPQEYPPTPPSRSELYGGWTNRSDDPPFGGRHDDLAVQQQWWRRAAQHQTRVAQISSTLYMAT